MNSSPSLKPAPRRVTPDFVDRDRPLQTQATPFRLEDIIAILRKRAWIIAVTTCLAIAFAVVILTRTTPQYVASAEMLLGGQGRVERSSADLLEARAFNDTVIQGELAILRSSAMLVRVVEKLQLDQDPEFNPALRPPEPPSVVDRIKGFIKRLLFPPRPAPEPSTVEGTTADTSSQAVEEASAARDEMLDGLGPTIGALRSSISVRQRGSSSVVSVTVSSADPTKAAAIANTVVDEYINFVSDKRFEAAQRFTTWLETRVAELANAVEESEREVLAFRAIADSESSSSVRLEQQMQETTSKLVNARTTLAETEARATKARELLENEGALAAAGVLSSPSLDEYTARIALLRQSETDAVRRFGSDSAQAVALRRETSDVNSALEMEVRQVISELDNSAEVSRINVDALQANLGQIESVMLDRSKEEIRLNQLERVADANRRLYADFLGRFKESSEIQNLRTADAEVISYSSPPGAPATPREGTTLVLATAAGGFLGLGLIFLLELLPKRFSTSDEVMQHTGLKVFGYLPRLPRRNTAHRLARLLGRKGENTLARGAQNMLRNLELGLGRQLRSALLVSQASGRDKTTLAVLLGWAVTQQGRSCLIVDADMRGAALSRRFNLAQGPSLVDVLYDTVPVGEVIRTDPDLGINILPARPASADTATLFDTKRADALFRDLIERYDVVIIDAPPLKSVSDLVSLETPVDIGLYAVTSQRTAIKSAVQEMSLFRKLNAEIAGAALMRVRSQTVR